MWWQTDMPKLRFAMSWYMSGRCPCLFQQHEDIPDKVFTGNNIKTMMKSPFKFPDSYTITDCEIFFGRDQEIH